MRLRHQCWWQHLWRESHYCLKAKHLVLMFFFFFSILSWFEFTENLALVFIVSLCFFFNYLFYIFFVLFFQNCFC